MKAQITLFVVLGIIVMIILGFGLFIRDVILENKISESSRTAFREFEQSTSLNTYLKSCVRKVTNNGVTLLGVQGGYIYEEQGGTQARPLTMSNIQEDFRGVERSYDLAYWILNQTNNWGYIFVIPKLCSKTGPNRLGISDSSVNTCQFIDVYGDEGDNIQDSLSAYIDNSLAECLDIDIYKTTLGNEIIEGEPKSEVIFAQDSFLVEINYPFTIKIKGEDPEVQVVNFTYESDVKLQKMYNFMKLLVEEEAINESYNPQNEFRNIALYEEGFVVQVFADWNLINNPACTNNCYDNLLWLKDDNVLIDNKPYAFMVAIQDRIPSFDDD